MTTERPLTRDAFRAVVSEVGTQRSYRGDQMERLTPPSGGAVALIDR